MALPLGNETSSALDLYPAQRAFARFFKCAIRICARLGLPLPLVKGELILGKEEPFVRWMCSLAGEEFSVAVLAGNPNAVGRRWIVAIFKEGIPFMVIKAGITPEARELIAREVAFLHANSDAIPGIPKPRASLDVPSVCAFALDFVSGDAPQHACNEQLGAILGAQPEG